MIELHPLSFHILAIAMYKDQVEFLKSIIKEKEEMYRVLVKVIDKKK